MTGDTDSARALVLAACLHALWWGDAYQLELHGRTMRIRTAPFGAVVHLPSGALDLGLEP